MSRPPLGERGLKLDRGDMQYIRAKSLPARGAWVEIINFFIALTRPTSRSPHGERGLKCIAERVGRIERRVAPRTGSVG